MGITALDTETQDGRAILITMPNAWTEPKSWEDCVDFASQKPHLAAYNADYDFAAFLKWLPAVHRNTIALLSEATFTRNGIEWRIRYVKRKFAKVWKSGKLMFTLYDIAQFHNTSLAKACERFGVDQRKTKIPKSWYPKMAEKLRDPKTRWKVIGYGLQDARALQALIDKTKEKFANAGVDFVRPMSNASFAERRFKENFSTRVPYRIERMAQYAFYGGRIEPAKVGYFPVAWLYDIRSAYPSVMTRLIKPDGQWLWNQPLRDDASYAYLDCAIEVPTDIHLGPVAVRDGLGISYPAGRFRRILTLPEYNLIRNSPTNWGKIRGVFRSVQHIGGTGTRPFRDIDNLYAERLANPHVEYAVKILINSAYGKTAQTIEKREASNYFSRKAELINGEVYEKTTYRKRTTCFVYASEITAAIRCKLYSAANHDTVISFATDSILSTSPLDHLPLSKNLGDWGVEEVRDVIVVGSGVYAYTHKGKDGKDERVTKFRGFASSLNLEETLRKAGRLHRVPMKVLRNTSLIRAINNPDGFNVLKTETRYLDVNFDKKRFWPIRWNASDLLTNQYDSQVLIKYPSVTLPFSPIGWGKPEE